tara:strand:- start:956 stop:1420 length:465 start_codon:yes stop_codon:yes gene_type:complete
MENHTEFKWYQKPATVIILLIFFFPVGLYLMWNNELWTKQTRWIVTGVLALVVIANAGNDKNSNSNSGVESESKITKVTFSEAEAFMQNRCNSINQTLMKKKSVNFNGTKLYMFLSVAENGYVCITSVSENALEVLAADCGPSEKKLREWNAVN